MSSDKVTVTVTGPRGSGVTTLTQHLMGVLNGNVPPHVRTPVIVQEGPQPGAYAPDKRRPPQPTPSRMNGLYNSDPLWRYVAVDLDRPGEKPITVYCAQADASVLLGLWKVLVQRIREAAPTAEARKGLYGETLEKWQKYTAELTADRDEARATLTTCRELNDELRKSLQQQSKLAAERLTQLDALQSQAMAERGQHHTWRRIAHDLFNILRNKD